MAIKKHTENFLKSHAVKNFVGHLIQGLLVIAPTAITIFVVYKIIDFIGSSLGFIHLMVHPLIDPFIILFAIVIIVYIVGRISSSFLFTPMYDRFEKDIEKVPLIRLIYSSVKDITSAFVGSKKKFNKPVLVTLDKINGIKQIGFITQDDLTNMAIDKEFTAVYMPFSYGLSGKLLVVPKENIVPLDVTSAEAMKFVVSGGVTNVD
ncbi:MAG: DUF502 domain-containing protein [Bacteroidia bacterium]